MRSTPIRLVVAALTAMILCVVPAVITAQQVVFAGPTDDPALEALHRVVARNQYLVIQRDTVLPPEFHTAGDLIVWDARVRLEGQVEGAAVSLQGTLIVRPGARVGGPIVAVGGLVLPSGLASVGERIELSPEYRVAVRRDAERLQVTAFLPPPVRRFGLGGIFGFRQVDYDRVNGLSVAWGPQWRLAAREFGPRADAWITLRSARLQPGGGIQLALPIGGGMEAAITAERTTLTNEWWIRDGLWNSIGALMLGRDLRDYHESDQISLRLARSPRVSTAGTALDIAPHLVIRHSRDRALEAQRPWAITGRTQLDRPNLPVLATEIASLGVGTTLAWHGASSTFAAITLAEYGRVTQGDLRFARWLANGRWDMQALWNHQLTVAGHGIGSLGDSPAPPQRWSFVGGQGTLPTLPMAALRGDRLVFLESRYQIPLGFIEPPLLGVPWLELLHATGTAWQTGQPMPAWEQNLGAGLAFSFFRARAWIDPSIDRPRPTVLLEFASP
jgi:hypothetical protein